MGSDRNIGEYHSTSLGPSSALSPVGYPLCILVEYMDVSGDIEWNIFYLGFIDNHSRIGYALDYL